MRGRRKERRGAGERGRVEGGGQSCVCAKGGQRKRARKRKRGIEGERKGAEGERKNARKRERERERERDVRKRASKFVCERARITESKKKKLQRLFC